jgi:TetR/AcrR family transcriptional regulator, transcriptional repressor for nem operon
MPPGRPREFDVERALEAAMDLFWGRGYRNTTTRDLEAALGVKQSSLYRAFGSKAGLLDAVLERYQALIDRELLDPLLNDRAGLASVDRFFAGLGDWLAEDGARGCLIGRLMSERAHPEPDVEERLAHYRAKLRRSLEAALGRAAKAGEIREDTVQSRAGVLVAMVLGLNLAVQAGYDRESRQELALAIRGEIGHWEGELAPDRRVAAAETEAADPGSR